MTTAQLLMQLKAARMEMERLEKLLKANNDKVRKQWKDKFVRIDQNGSIILNTHLTPLGEAELKKYGLEYYPWKTGAFWENPGVQYEPNDCFCMICHSKNVVAFLDMGFTSRFAACPKHCDFTYMTTQIRKIPTETNDTN